MLALVGSGLFFPLGAFGATGEAPSDTMSPGSDAARAPDASGPPASAKDAFLPGAAPDGAGASSSADRHADPSEICKIDPAACPSLDLKAEAATTSDEPLYATAQVRSLGGLASKSSERFVLPAGVGELGGDVALITSGPVLTDHELQLTNLGLFRLRGRQSFGTRVELRAGTSLLAKQPVDAHEGAWQGAFVGTTFEPTRGFAFTFDASFSPLLYDAGSAWQVTPGLMAKWRLDRYARLLLGVGSIFTALDAEGGFTPRAFVEEGSAEVEAQLGGDDGGFWLTTDYRVPFASRGDRPGSPSVPLDAPVTLSLEVGGVLTVSDTWDLFASYAFVDHGELERPETTLPILDGGFDQRQLVFGVQHRFLPKRPRHRAP